MVPLYPGTTRAASSGLVRPSAALVADLDRLRAVRRTRDGIPRCTDMRCGLFSPYPSSKTSHEAVGPDAMTRARRRDGVGIAWSDGVMEDAGPTDRSNSGEMKGSEGP